MSNQTYEKQLFAWAQFRQTLETAEDPINDTIKYWNRIPTTARCIDPYNTDTWPTPWELIEENAYCQFGKLLAIAYTLKLTDRFKDWQPIFKIGVDKHQLKIYYMLFIGDQVIGLDHSASVHIKYLPSNIEIEKVHVLTAQY